MLDKIFVLVSYSSLRVIWKWFIEVKCRILFRWWLKIILMYERDIIMESGRWNNGAAKNLIIKERDVLCWSRAEINFWNWPDILLHGYSFFCAISRKPWSKQSNLLLNNRRESNSAHAKSCFQCRDYSYRL